MDADHFRHGGLEEGPSFSQLLSDDDVSAKGAVVFPGLDEPVKVTLAFLIVLTFPTRDVGEKNAQQNCYYIEYRLISYGLRSASKCRNFKIHLINYFFIIL